MLYRNNFLLSASVIQLWCKATNYTNKQIMFSILMVFHKQTHVVRCKWHHSIAQHCYQSPSSRRNAEKQPMYEMFIMNNQLSHLISTIVIWLPSKPVSVSTQCCSISPGKSSLQQKILQPYPDRCGGACTWNTRDITQTGTSHNDLQLFFMEYNLHCQVARSTECSRVCVSLR